MAKYKSPHYPALGFYVNGSFRRFSGGLFITEDDEEIKVLDSLSDAIRVDEAKTEEPKAVAEVEPEAEKPKPARRTSTKASAK